MFPTPPIPLILWWRDVPHTAHAIDQFFQYLPCQREVNMKMTPHHRLGVIGGLAHLSHGHATFDRANSQCSLSFRTSPFSPEQIGGRVKEMRVENYSKDSLPP